MRETSGGLTQMEPTEAEKLKARRTQVLLYWMVAVMIGVPGVIFFLRVIGLVSWTRDDFADG